MDDLLISLLELRAKKMLACIRYCRIGSKFSAHSGGWEPQGR